MKLVAFCVFAVFCSSLANTSTNGIDRTSERRKLQEVLTELNDVKISLQHSEKLMNTPPKNIEDCCWLSALECFQRNLYIGEKKQKKLYRSLNHSLTKGGMNFCNSGNNSTCQSCDSHPKKNTTESFQRLESLIQNAITRLSMN